MSPREFVKLPEDEQAEIRAIIKRVYVEKLWAMENIATGYGYPRNVIKEVCKPLAEARDAAKKRRHIYHRGSV